MQYVRIPLQFKYVANLSMHAKVTGSLKVSHVMTVCLKTSRGPYTKYRVAGVSPALIRVTYKTSLRTLQGIQPVHITERSQLLLCSEVIGIYCFKQLRDTRQ